MKQRFIAISRWLHNRDIEVSMSRPERWHIRWPKLEHAFYPPNKGRSVARADRVMIWVILFACMAAVLEFVAPPNTETAFFWVTVVFLAIFMLEFAARLYLRGMRYFLAWGVLDIFVILVDVVAVGLHLLVYYFPEQQLLEASAFAPMLRTIRLLRFLRFLKLFVYFKDITYLKSLANSVAPIVKALMWSLTFMAGIVGLSLLASFFMFGSESESGLWRIVTLIWNSLTSSTQTSTVTNTEVLEGIYRATAVMVAIGVTTIVTQIFTTLLTRFASKEESEVIAGLSGHVVLALNDASEAGLIDEVLEVFEAKLSNDIVILAPESEFAEMAHRATRRIHVLSGEIEDAGTWARANVSEAGIILNLGKPVLGDNDYRTLLIASSGLNSDADLTVVNIAGDLTYRRNDSQSAPRVAVIDVPLDELVNALELSLWDSTSIGFQLMQRKIDQLDDEVEVPDIQWNDTPQAGQKAQGIADRLQQKFRDANCGDILIDRDASRLRVSLGPDEDEAAEVAMISILDEFTATESCDLSEVNIFVFVRSFPLVQWNSVFQATGRKEVCVFAIELGAVFAIHHELKAPYSMLGWLHSGNPNAYKLQGVRLGGDVGKKFRSRSEVADLISKNQVLPETSCVLAVQGGEFRGSDDTVRVFLDKDTDRRRCGNNSRVFVVSR